MLMLNMMKTARILLGALAVTALCAFSADSRVYAASGTLPEDYPLSEPLCVQGTISRDGGRFSLTQVSGDISQEEIILNISDETKILDAVNGFPVAAEAIEDGETVYAYISQAMALSLPPQSHAEVILCQIPADFAVPSYETVDHSVFLTPGSTIDKTAFGQVATRRGNTWAVVETTSLLPFLTRNIVGTDSLTSGRKCLLWPAGSVEDVIVAGKVVIFPEN